MFTKKEKRNTKNNNNTESQIEIMRRTDTERKKQDRNEKSSLGKINNLSYSRC